MSDTTCDNCSNRGKIKGFSQESFCEQCVHSHRYLKNHFSPLVCSPALTECPKCKNDINKCDKFKSPELPLEQMPYTTVEQILRFRTAALELKEQVTALEKERDDLKQQCEFWEAEFSEARKAGFSDVGDLWTSYLAARLM